MTASEPMSAVKPEPQRWPVTKAELHRWTSEPVVLITVVALIAVSALLTYFAVNVATGGASSGADGVELQTDIVLNADATNDQLASMARSSLSMLVPIAAIILGVHAAGSEMSSGALLQIAVAARRLRFVFVVRAVILLVIMGVAGATAGAATLATTAVAVARTSELAHLSAWHGAGSTIIGASAQAVLFGLIAFGLSALTRRWVAVIIGMLVYLIGLESVLAGLLGDAGVWLPGVATAELLTPEPDLVHVVPTVLCALALVILAVLSLRREWAAR